VTSLRVRAQELWSNLASATANGTGVPQALLDAKAAEVQKRAEAQRVIEVSSRDRLCRTVRLVLPYTECVWLSSISWSPSGPVPRSSSPHILEDDMVSQSDLLCEQERINADQRKRDEEDRKRRDEERNARREADRSRPDRDRDDRRDRDRDR